MPTWKQANVDIDFESGKIQSGQSDVGRKETDKDPV